MSGFADIYVIKKNRSKKLAIQFLEHFLPQREETTDEYLIPQNADNPITEFQNADSTMDYLESHPNFDYGIYWRNLDQNNRNMRGMIFYIPDSYMIFGISRYPISFENTENEEECLSEMKTFLDTDEGYITYECPPEDTYSEFANLIVQYNKSKTQN